MKTFSKIKGRIKQYTQQMEQLQEAVLKEREELKQSVYSLWSETKFIVGKKGTSRDYFYLSIIDPVSNDFFTGIWVDSRGKLTIGKISFLPFYEFDEYEAISPKRFFGKLRTLGVKLNEHADPVSVECCRYKPAIIEDVDDTYKAVGYCRLSQNGKAKNLYDRQISLINSFAKYDIRAAVSEIFAETVQGTVPVGQRKAVSEMLEYCACNDIYTVVVSEMNRLGRTENVIMTGISYLMKRGIREIYCIKEKILINEEFICEHYRELKRIAKSCETEYEDIRHRMKSGYDTFIEKAKQSNGTIKIGRPSDYRKPKEQYFSQYQKEIDFLLKGELSLRQIHTVTGTSVGTLQKIKHLLAQTATVQVANENAQ